MGITSPKKARKLQGMSPAEALATGTDGSTPWAHMHGSAGGSAGFLGLGYMGCMGYMGYMGCRVLGSEYERHIGCRVLGSGYKGEGV